MKIILNKCKHEQTNAFEMHNECLYNKFYTLHYPYHYTIQQNHFNL